MARTGFVGAIVVKRRLSVAVHCDEDSPKVAAACANGAERTTRTSFTARNKLPSIAPCEEQSDAAQTQTPLVTAGMVDAAFRLLKTSAARTASKISSKK